MAIESFTKPQLDPSETGRVLGQDPAQLPLAGPCCSGRGDGDVHLALNGTRDPYQVTGNGAGFLMCWRNDVRWNIHADDDPKRFMTVDSGEYVLAIPDYSLQVREEAAPTWRGRSASPVTSSYQVRATFIKKVVMKLSGKVQWLGRAGL